MRLQVRGFLDGYYVGRPGRELPHAVGGAVRHRIEVYRATFDRIEPVDGDDATASPASRAEAPGLRQAHVPMARVYSPEGRGRVFEGVLTDVHVVEPHYAGKARRGETIYGRVSGWATATLDLPDAPPEPEAPALWEVTPAVSEVARVGRVESAPLEPGRESPADAGAGPNAVEDAPEPVAAAASGVELPADPPVAAERVQGDDAPARSTSLLLVGAIVVALALAATASGAYAGIWLTLALPTLMFRRMFHGMLEDVVGVRGLAVTLVLGQVAATISAWAALRVESCHPLAGWALVVGLGAVFLAGLLPWRLPLIVNGLAFALMLWPAAQPRPERCRTQQQVEPRSVHDPRAPRTNPDGSWPRRPQL